MEVLTNNINGQRPAAGCQNMVSALSHDQDIDGKIPSTVESSYFILIFLW